jgi:hypothetical protein
MKPTPKAANLAASIAVAIAAASVSLPASAVSLSDNGLGQVAIVPFYTTRGNDTYISIVNTDPVNVIYVKLRFREADNSRDARDFNIALSPNDVWTGAVTQNADGIPLVQTSDTSCTGPQLLDGVGTYAGAKGVLFTDVDYNGGTVLGRDAAADADVGIDRTEDGHFEVIMMGVSEPVMGAATPAADRNVAGYATHDSGYFNCAVVAAAMDPANRPVADMATSWADQTLPPLDVMKVAANFIDVDAGVAAMIPTYTLQAFSDVANPQSPASQSPNLNDATPAETTQIINGQVVQDEFPFGSDAVSSLIMATAVLNEYAVGGAGAALNDWVVTFPTKNFYVDASLMATVGIPVDPAAARPPFSEYFQTVTPAGEIEPGNGLSCELVTFGYYDREEGFPTDPSSPPEFSPLPDRQPDRDSLCFEVQTLSFGETSALNGRNNYGVQLEDGFTSGWMRLSFLGGPTENPGLAGDTATFFGLPVLSFGLKTYENGVANTGGILNYGFTQPAAYDRDGTY